MFVYCQFYIQNQIFLHSKISNPASWNQRCFSCQSQHIDARLKHLPYEEVIKKEFLGQSLCYKGHESLQIRSLQLIQHFINHMKKKPTSFHRPPKWQSLAQCIWNLVTVAFHLDARSNQEGGPDQGVSIVAFPNLDRAQLISELTSNIIVSYKHTNVNQRGGTVSPWGRGLSTELVA